MFIFVIQVFLYQGDDIMNKRILLRLISLFMFIVAAVFVFIAVSVPTLGKTIYIGDFAFDAHCWRICYGIYAAVMVIIFIASFFVKGVEK